MEKAALISVYDKKGVVELADFLIKKGYKIISTGSTARLLKQNNIDVVEVESYTGFQEMLDGRVKTLHPKIHGGILFVRENHKHKETVEKLGIYSIDVVVVNLYPFEEIAKKTSDEDKLIENIDIGGPTLLRAAAKNYRDVLVICDPDDYEFVINNFDSIDTKARREFAIKVFAKTSYYDGLIAKKLSDGSIKDKMALPFSVVSKLRYGENPHQEAFFAKDPFVSGLPELIQLNGRELSYNNILDIDVAYRMMVEFKPITCIIIKHNTPCGVATSNSLTQAYLNALSCDPVSAFGGIIGINETVDEELAKLILKRFYEVIVAFDYTQKALDILKTKKNLRVIKVNRYSEDFYEIRSIMGGYLIQQNDNRVIEKYEIVSKKQPTQQQIEDLLFAFHVAKFAKSNAVVYAKDKKTVAIGSGQTSRVDSAKFAIERAKQLNIDLKGCVMASDGFFPFRDSVDEAVKAGVEAIIEPGGSIRDKEVIGAADEHNIALLFSGIRHFRH